ncbi:hypothetical protein VP01_5821g1 [Puccinia sorghi]|uniref:Uncharacterized protein n=1 Tax=Puccinia sorghi TaxID=27349 RepID=A0A0L6UI74_9BASI|nr:hypothetical protein VP01_5821g1 [Puccinia sorghi]
MDMLRNPHGGSIFFFLVIERRCKECAQMNLECGPSTASQGNRMKCESCRCQKVLCRFPNGFPLGDPESRPIPPLPPSQAPSPHRCQTIWIPSTPEIVEVPRLFNQEFV